LLQGVPVALVAERTGYSHNAALTRAFTRIVGHTPTAWLAQQREQMKAAEEAMDAEAVGRAAMVLGAGRARKEDRIDPSVGLVVLAKTGTRVSRGDVLALVHARTREEAEAAVPGVLQAYRIGPTAPRPRPLVHGRVV
ncbi:MAG: hypothetical protein K6U07_09370, partial [Firmicutes bacterium]|nr:hypothetical protein [Bacillota bacterium]